MKNKNFYKAYFTVYHTDRNGHEYEQGYISRIYADTKEEALKEARRQSQERKTSESDRVADFEVQENICFEHVQSTSPFTH